MSPSISNGSNGITAKATKKNNNVKLEATKSMCYHCFDTLSEELHGKAKSSSWRPFRSSSSSRAAAIPPGYVKDLPDPAIECPLFITWDKMRPKAGFPSNLLGGSNNTDSNGQPVYELRGCIGSLSAKKLITAIGDYALTSALRDRRFQPVSAQEIPTLRVAVSLLVQYEPCSNCFDWIVGTHGILIRFWSSKANRDYSATYLPEVAKEQGWDQKASVTALIRKSGYSGKIDKELFDSIQCTRYQSSKVRMTYEEFLVLKQHHQSPHNGGDKSPPSTEPSSASSSVHHSEPLGGDEQQQQQQLYEPPNPKWTPNSCNNL